VVDPNASILSEDNYAEEGGVNGELHSRIGSTGKGVGACRLDRIRRNEQKHTICRNDSRLKQFIGDTAFLIRDSLASGKNVMLEGTQGSGLSLVHGPWPYVTTGDTNAAQLAADAGVPPAKVSRVVLVARTFPIRVAGNSGPMVNEISWPELSSRIGRTVEERTTVTKKVRRVSEWDDAVFSRAVAVNGPTEIALTFADYIGDGSCRNVNRWEEVTSDVKNFVAKVESDHKVNIRWVATGPKPEDVVDRNK
jgi:adenylosuccinate synthase